MTEPIKLRVLEALQDDAYKGIARIDTETMHKLGVIRGDFISIKGDRETVAIVERAYPTDVGEGVIRIDGVIRRNVKAGIGETVSISKADVKDAKKILVAPSQGELVIRGDKKEIEGEIRTNILGRVFVKGDLFNVGRVRNRQNSIGEGFGEDVFFGEIMKELSNMGVSPFGAGGFSGLKQIRFIVANATPNQAVKVTERTDLQLSDKPVEISESKVLEVTYEDIGGLDEEIKKIREMVELPLKHPEIFTTLGIEPPKGVLLYGPPGTGKTLLAKAVANETEANFILLNGPEIMSKFYGESEKKIRDIFEQAEKSAPAIIFIDEIDAIAPKREESYGEVERRVVSQILTMMDGLKSRGKVIVIGATNIPNMLDPALRRPGRFDREIEINVPDKRGRLSILKIHTRGMPIQPLLKKEYIDNKIRSLEDKIHNEETKLNVVKDGEAKNIKQSIEEYKKLLEELKQISKMWKENDKEIREVIKKFISDDEKRKNIFLEGMLEELAAITHGFVGADISALCKEAAMNVLRKVLPSLNLKEEQEIPRESLNKLRVADNDFRDALKTVRPSAMREVLVEKPNIKWADVGGLEQVKQELKEAIEWPLKYPDAFTRIGIRPPKGILLYGPPGTGKTLLAKAVANESEANFIPVKGPSLLSMWVGESEKGVRKIFERARQVSPCIVFFDEIDALASRRGYETGTKVTERVLNQLLAEIDGLEELQNVVVIGATNRPDMLDPALLRPGRFDRIISVGVPDKEGTLVILKIHTKNMPLARDVTLDKLAEKMEGYTGADIESVVREAGMLALRDDIKTTEVKKKYFEDAMKKVTASVKQEDIKRYKNIEETYLRSAKAALEKPNKTTDYLG